MKSNARCPTCHSMRWKKNKQTWVFRDLEPQLAQVPNLRHSINGVTGKGTGALRSIRERFGPSAKVP